MTVKGLTVHECYEHQQHCSMNKVLQEYKHKQGLQGQMTLYALLCSGVAPC